MSKVEKDQILAGLRGHIARIEGCSISGQTGPLPKAGADRAAPQGSPAMHRKSLPVISLGVAEIDARLPGHGLQTGRLHEVVGSPEGAGTGFVVHLLRRLMTDDRGGGNGATDHGGPVFWCAPQVTLYPPGLACRGLDVDRIVMVTASRREDRLWAMEESLRAPGVLAVVGELRGRESLDLTASRRLQLAADQGGAMALLLRPPPPGLAAGVTAGAGQAPDGQGGDVIPGQVLGASAAVTRWLVRAVPTAETATPGNDDMGRRSRWLLALTRSRTGARHHWIVEVDHATGDFALASSLRDRSGPSAQRSAVA